MKCDVCGVVDDRPKHVLVLNGRLAQRRHLTCCAEKGCPDGTCERRP